MDKGTFKILKALLKSLENDASEMTNELADRAAESRKKLFKNLAKGSLEHLVEFRAHIMNDMYELADKVDSEARDMKLDENGMQYLSEFVANTQVLRECERLIQEKLDEIKTNSKKD